MIVGNGLIASAFNRSNHLGDDITVFASGVSNSKEARGSEFQRELELLLDATRSSNLIVYFSTCSIADGELSETPYVQHKNQMEQIVRGVDRYAIFRLPQVVGFTKNPHTLTNYLYRSIAHGEAFHILSHATRRLIDVADVAEIVTKVIRSASLENFTENLVPPDAVRVLDLVKIFEKVLEKKALYSLIDGGGSYSVDFNFTREFALAAGVKFDEHYNERLIRKYYGRD